ncbi:MAG: neutral/alkaline non-lysosomal ceramidase N-terminal domain-containing protein [Bryobacterales bacterium]|nr:neutral/alkaline non-lysosomal ceramidase N-terminal domain-containing protein [Bryobacterales bacterium]
MLANGLRSCAVSVCLLAAAFPLWADPKEQGVRTAGPSGLQAGVARVDISPPIAIPHMNWGSAVHLEADGIAPPGLFATALALSDGQQRYVMVDMDLLFGGGLEVVRERAAQKTGIPIAHIRLGASHTHAGPAFSPERAPIGADLSRYKEMMDRYRNTLEDKLVGVIIAATKQMQPVHLYAGRGTGTININRRFRGKNGAPPAVGRNEEGFVDRELPVIRVDRADGNPLAIIANFQCHGTVMGFENKYISADWVGDMRATVERAYPGTLCLFFQGAAGNQGPIEGFTGDLDVARRLGQTLGFQVAAVASQIDTVRREPVFEGFIESTAYQAKQYWRVKGPRDSKVRFVSRVFEVPARTYTPQEIAGKAAIVADAEARLAKATASGDAWAKAQAEARVRRERNLLQQWRNAKPGRQVEVEMSLLRIGDVAILAMPGEPFAEIGVALKKASPFAYTLFCGYSSGKGTDYMPIDEEYQHGGYEVERTPYGREAAKSLIEQARRLYDEVK